MIGADGSGNKTCPLVPTRAWPLIGTFVTALHTSLELLLAEHMAILHEI
jgi:hypothetical protein